MAAKCIEVPQPAGQELDHFSVNADYVGAGTDIGTVWVSIGVVALVAICVCVIAVCTYKRYRPVR